VIARSGRLREEAIEALTEALAQTKVLLLSASRQRLSARLAPARLAPEGVNLRFFARNYREIGSN
jgi:hypothetical protein